MNAIETEIDAYFRMLAHLIRAVAITDAAAASLTIEDGFSRVRRAAHAAHDTDNKIMFIGNGGSASIASHLAIDFSKNGGLRSLAFNDPAALTCLGNDLGYGAVFEQQIDLHARSGDLLIAISSSGKSPNILAGVSAARARGCGVVTFSGFSTDNALRRMGDINFHIASSEYGFVEIAHLSLCHAILDLDTGWTSTH